MQVYLIDVTTEKQVSAEIGEARGRVLVRPQGAGPATKLLAVSSSKGTGQSTVMDNKPVVIDGKEIVMELGTVRIL